MTVKEIKDQLQKGNVNFTVKGITKYQRGGVNNEYGDFPKVLKVSADADHISECDLVIWSGMNVEKWGPTCVWLYTFDMLNNRSKGKIKYSDVTIIEQ